MKVVNKKMVGVLVVTLMLIEVCSLFLVYKSFTNKETKLDEVRLQIKEKEDMLAIMIEQEDGTYVESSNSTWPTEGYKYDEEKSGCIDINGNKIEGSLTYDSSTSIVTVDTDKTSNCYVYFKIDPLSEIINSSDIWKSTLEGDGYRFVGTNPSNYICFGTSDKDTCTGNNNLYMYRIIGIFEDEMGEQHLKLIKKDALNSYAWHNSNTAEVSWRDSVLYSGLNDSYFLTKSTFNYLQDNLWLNKISTWNFIAGTSSGVSYRYTPVNVVYLHEMNIPSKQNGTCYSLSSVSVDCNIGTWDNVSAKIGLMYVSDYLLSLGSNSLTYISNSNYSTLKNGWIHYNGDHEWTMTNDDNTNSYYIYSDGRVISTGHINTRIVRPVFYLTSDIMLKDGTGTIDNPYIIE